MNEKQKEKTYSKITSDKGIISLYIMNLYK